MARTGLLCDRDWRYGGFPVIKESVQTSARSVRVHSRKISSFLDVDRLVDISLAELARIKEDEFAYRNLVFILPSVTVCSTKTDYRTFCRLVTHEHYLWHYTLRSRIGNKGLRWMRRLMSNSNVRILFSGVWIIETLIFLNSIVEIKERIKSWAIN